DVDFTCVEDNEAGQVRIEFGARVWTVAIHRNRLLQQRRVKNGFGLPGFRRMSASGVWRQSGREIPVAPSRPHRTRWRFAYFETLFGGNGTGQKPQET